MNTSLELWEKFSGGDMPEKSDIIEIIKQHRDVNVKAEDITEEYILQQKLYRFLVGMFILNKTGLNLLDDRIYSKGYSPVDYNEMSFFQKYDMMGLKYFYLRSYVHIERLNDNDINILNDCVSNPSENSVWKKAMKVVENTYRQVLAVSGSQENVQIEIYRSVNGEGIVDGKDILFCLKTGEKDLDVDCEMESIKAQLEPILSRCLDTNVRVLMEE